MKKLIAALVSLLLLLGAAGAETYLLADIGEEAEVLDSAYEDDGAYWEEYRIDGDVHVRLGRYSPDDEDAKHPLQFPGEVSHTQFWLDIEPISGYPTRYCRIFSEFLKGRNEDMRVVSCIFIFTDDWTYYVEIRVPRDLEEDYAAEVERIIASLSIEGDMDVGTESQPYPFDWADVEDYLLLPFETDTDTLGELAELLGANWFTWVESDAEDDALRLSLAGDWGSVEVDIEGDGDLLPEGIDFVGQAELPEQLIHAQGVYAFRAARWDADVYPLPTVRGLQIGDPMQSAIDAFTSGEIESIGGESGFSQLLTYAIEAVPGEDSDPWERAELRIYGNGGIIEFMWLEYATE